MKTLQEMVQELPPELQREVRDFVEFLLMKQARRAPSRPKLTWWGGAKALREQYSSVELQHKANEWRIENMLKSDEVSSGQ